MTKTTTEEHDTMELPKWLSDALPHNHQRRVRAERAEREAQVQRAIEEADVAATKLIRAVDQVFEDHADPIAYMVHVGMDYKRWTKKKGDIG